MDIGKRGIWASTNALNRAQLGDLARRTEANGYSALWYPESTAYEALALGGYLLGRTERLVAATGIAKIYARDAMAAVQGHNTLNALYDGRFLLGLGVSHQPIMEGARGHEYGKPLSAMRAYLDGMDAAEVAVEVSARQVVLAALGPKMLALAAERTLGALPYNVTPEHTRTAREIMGPDALLCVEQAVCLTSSAATARKVAASHIERYLRLPNYYNNWLRTGFGGGELAGGGSEKFLDAMVAWGEPDDIEAVVQAHFDAGADHVCIQPLDPQGDATPDWAAVEALAPKG